MYSLDDCTESALARRCHLDENLTMYLFEDIIKLKLNNPILGFMLLSLIRYTF